MVKVTSGGTESGARPILEQHCDVDEKGAVCCREAKAGTRKAGRTSSRVFEVDNTLLSARDEREQCSDAISDTE